MKYICPNRSQTFCDCISIYLDSYYAKMNQLWTYTEISATFISDIVRSAAEANSLRVRRSLLLKLKYFWRIKYVSTVAADALAKVRNWVRSYGIFPCLPLRNISIITMTSLNENTFRDTGPLWGESNGHRCIPPTKTNDAELWCFLWSAPEQTAQTPRVQNWNGGVCKRLRKQWRRRWFETPSRSLWRHCNYMHHLIPDISMSSEDINANII